MTDSLADPAAARAHARAQGGTVVETMPILPASAADGWPADLDPDRMLWAETVAGGGYTALAVQRGAIIELTDVDGDAAPHVILFNALHTDERFNVADTVKVQWQAYPGAGTAMLSDRGRVLATIVADGSGLHDTFTGTSTIARNTQRYGAGDAHSESPAGRELLILAAAKFGLEPRDLPTGITFFRESRVDESGAFGEPRSAGAGAHLQLRTEMPVIVLIANAPHPLDPREEYVVSPVRVRVWRDAGASAGASDPEIQRAMLNTESYLRLRGELS